MDLALRVALICFALNVTGLQLRSPLKSRLSMACEYEYEADGAIEQLSLQWRSPGNQLLCHFIKHKSYRNCSRGYSVLYVPGNVTLTIGEVKEEDYGTHVCSVSKRHAFSDYAIEVVREAEPSTTPAADKQKHSGYAQEHLFLLGCSLFVSVFGC